MLSCCVGAAPSKHWSPDRIWLLVAPHLERFWFNGAFHPPAQHSDILQRLNNLKPSATSRWWDFLPEASPVPLLCGDLEGAPGDEFQEHSRIPQGWISGNWLHLPVLPELLEPEQFLTLFYSQWVAKSTEHADNLNIHFLSCRRDWR